MGDNVVVCEDRCDSSITGSADIPADFKPTLPPRKRAKTQEEKEQRRIERILRNRKAAHHSREKKRLHLQLLERKCNVMEKILSKVGNLDDLFEDDEEGRALIREYDSVSSECSSPRGGYSPMNVMKQSEDCNEVDLDMDNVVTPAQQHKEDSDFLTAVHSSSESCASFSPNMALTPVSFVKDETEAKNWDLLLTNEENTYTTGVTTTTTNIATNNATIQQDDNSLFPQLWLPFDGNEESSFELDDWRNPAVITATTCI